MMEHDTLFQQLFSSISGETNPNIEYKIKCSYLEIYLEQVADLIRPETKNLKV